MVINFHLSSDTYRQSDQGLTLISHCPIADNNIVSKGKPDNSEDKA